MFPTLLWTFSMLVWVAIIADKQVFYFVWIQSLVPHHHLIQVNTNVPFVFVYKLSSNDHLPGSTFLFTFHFPSFVTSNQGPIVIDQQTVVSIDECLSIDECQVMPTVIHGFNPDFVSSVSQHQYISEIQCWDYTILSSEGGNPNGSVNE